MSWAAVAAAAGSVISGVIQSNEHKGLTNDIKDLTQFDPSNFQGLGGSIDSASGQFSADPQTQALFNSLQQGSMGLTQGGLFGNEQFQQTLGQANLPGAYQNQSNMLSQLMGNQAFGGLGAQYGNVMGLANQYGSALSGNTFAETQASELANLRAAAQPEQNRLMNKLDDRLFAKGMLGANTTRTGEAYRGLGEAFGQQDLNFQTQAFERAMGQRGQQLGAFQGLQGLGLGIEGQGFGQGLQALQQNQSAGQQRLQNAFGLFDMGQGFLTGGAQAGSQLANAAYNQQQFGMEGLLGLLNAEANRIGSTGMHAQALGNRGDSGMGGLLGGAAESLIGLLG